MTSMFSVIINMGLGNIVLLALRLSIYVIEFLLLSIEENTPSEYC